MDADSGVIMEMTPSATFQILRTQQAELNSELAQLTPKYGDSYPKVVQLRTQLEQVEGALRAEERSVRQRLEGDYRAALRAEQMAKVEVDRQKQEAYKLNEVGIQFLILKGELEGSRDLYEDLQKKLKEAGIVAGLKSTTVNVVDAAEVPVRPAEPRIPLTMTLATLLGLICGLGVAFGRESLDTTISDPQMLETLVDLPLLSVVPHMRLARHKGKRTLGEECGARQLPEAQSAFTESFRILRSTLMLSTVGKPPKVLVVTSALPSEGKSLTATNIAFALAQNGRQVLLLDGDMRRSPLDERLGLRVKSGLSNCLASGMEPDEAIVAFPEMPNLHILTAGERPPTPPELLDSERMLLLCVRGFPLARATRSLSSLTIRVD